MNITTEERSCKYANRIEKPDFRLSNAAETNLRIEFHWAVVPCCNSILPQAVLVYSHMNNSRQYIRLLTCYYLMILIVIICKNGNYSKVSISLTTSTPQKKVMFLPQYSVYSSLTQSNCPLQNISVSIQTAPVPLGLAHSL